MKNPDCGCQLLTFKDYTDMLWTTLAEFPGTIIICQIFMSKLCTLAVGKAVLSGCHHMHACLYFTPLNITTIEMNM